MILGGRGRTSFDVYAVLIDMRRDLYHHVFRDAFELAALVGHVDLEIIRVVKRDRIHDRHDLLAGLGRAIDLEQV